MKSILFFVFFTCTLSIFGNAKDNYFIEAESFSFRGGWYLDHQAFNKIGSSYLMAHGLGKPVEDAFTELTIDKPGYYHIYVSTYNWTSPWYKGKGPGAFCVKINDKIVTDTLGVTGDRWLWQYAGKIKLEGNVKIFLHDLSGFNGRVDAIYLSRKKEKMPQTYESMLKFRKDKLVYKHDTVVTGADLIVVGGGVAGCSTALTAARLGLNVVLVDNLPKLGGNNYLGVRMCGLMCYNLYPNVGNIVRELSGIPNEGYFLGHYLERVGNGNGYPIMSEDLEEIAELREKLLREENVRIFHNTHIFQASYDDKIVTSVTGRNLITNEDYIFKGKRFVDCTGDGVVGFLLGAEYHIGRESKSFANEPSAPDSEDQMKLGSTLSWDSVDENIESSFPKLSTMPWAMQCSKDYYVDAEHNEWTWETGFEIDNAIESELVRDNMLRAIFGNWSYLKNNVPKYKTFRLNEVSHIAQKRESRRIIGDIVLNENDIRNMTEYPDASFTTTWTLDLHYPQESNSKYFPGWEWQSYSHNNDSKTWIKPYHVPYRVLYSKDFDNLFIGGRNMSVTHIALGTVRVQATLGMAGEVIGMAAKICDKYNITPREVYEKYLYELKKYMRKGIQTKK